MRTGEGSSPRMRGAQLKTIGSEKFNEDHPRGCGEHDMVTTITEDNAGSSPRMRGAPHLYDETSNHSGIIPADAGSTPLLFCSSLITQDHPRGCGEHLRAYDVARVRPGSSPRMRGARLSSSCPSDLLRIIPADAGSTPSTRSRPVSTGDHPRGCGEHVAE